MKSRKVNPVLIIAAATAVLLNGCTLFGPYSSTPTYLAGNKPSVGIEEITTSDSATCKPDDRECKHIAKLVMSPTTADVSVLIQNGEKTFFCASPASVAKSLAYSGGGNFTVSPGSGAAVAIGASGASAETVTPILSADTATHYIAAASFYNCLAVASGYLDPAVAADNQKSIIQYAAEIATGSTKSPDTPTTGVQIAGVVVGMKGKGLVLSDGSDSLPVAATDETFSFTTKIDKSANYTISVKASPAKQSCSLLSPSTATVSGDVKNVVVTCKDA